MKIGRHIIRIVNFVKCILINVQGGGVTDLGQVLLVSEFSNYRLTGPVTSSFVMTKA